MKQDVTRFLTSPPIVTFYLFPWLLQAGNTWTSKGCTQSCTCIEGAIQCQNSQCPPGTYCKDSSDGSGSCVEISKGAVGAGRGGTNFQVSEDSAVYVCSWLGELEAERKRAQFFALRGQGPEVPQERGGSGNP